MLKKSERTGSNPTVSVGIHLAGATFSARKLNLTRITL